MSFADTLTGSLDLVLQWQSLGALALGVLIGIVAGAIPGMTATMAVALVLPFTFNLSPLIGILLLVGIYKGGIYGGSIPAILIKTPGTPAASATLLDGYPLAQQGRAGEALSISLLASAIADMISNLALILFAGWLASFALRFGPPEFFTLILFSLTIIAGVSESNMIKGMISAVFGLFLATIGFDLVYGTERFTFGSVELSSGLNFIAVLIGLFAIPEIMTFYIDRVRDTPQTVGDARAWVSRADFKRCLPTILRGSVIGVIMGAIPGIGSSPAAFLSYNEARRRSKRRNNFGKGELEGVAAAESGNNAVAGATLIPLLALGVPGDVVTAIIIGAFMVHGISPGPLMFVTHSTMIYALFISLIVSSVLMLVIGAVAIRGFSQIARISKDILFPSVLVLCVYGVYAVNNNLFDVGVMLTMGVIGYGMLKADLPAPPFLIAFILGPLFEDKFRQSLLMSNGDLTILFRSPITWFFWTVTLLTIFFLVRSALRINRKEVSQ